MTSERGPRVAWQGSLFDGEEGGTRLSFDRLRRDALDDHSWLDVVPGWVPDHGDLFDRLLAIAPWQQRTRTMWESEVLEPRLRDGSDAVAWHADAVRKVLTKPLVATICLGARRSFLLRPAAGGPVARRYAPGEGDLIVMGGACQHDWHHTVPRQKSASGARMSITLRHSRPRGPA